MMKVTVGNSSLEPVRTDTGPVIRLSVEGDIEPLDIPVNEFESLVVAYNAVRNFALAQGPRQ